MFKGLCSLCENKITSQELVLFTFINKTGGKSTQLPQNMNGVYDIGFWMCRDQSQSKSTHIGDRWLHHVFNILHLCCVILLSLEISSILLSINTFFQLSPSILNPSLCGCIICSEERNVSQFVLFLYLLGSFYFLVSHIRI